MKLVRLTSGYDAGGVQGVVLVNPRHIVSVGTNGAGSTVRMEGGIVYAVDESVERIEDLVGRAK